MKDEKEFTMLTVIGLLMFAFIAFASRKGMEDIKTNGLETYEP
ncbi:MAG: hypothetical protein R3346_04230 [Candidatus Spechtbacterales bacterium]|nr:hypothetical protein [Candidatus Spechtbacterales bacterium]